MGRLCSQFHQSISDCQTYEYELNKFNLPSVIDIDWACSASITVFAEVVVEYERL